MDRYLPAPSKRRHGRLRADMLNHVQEMFVTQAHPPMYVLDVVRLGRSHSMPRPEPYLQIARDCSMRVAASKILQATPPFFTLKTQENNACGG